MKNALCWYYDRRQQATNLLTGCPIIDKAIGGFPQLGITEVTGEAGCGKTQICLQLCLRCQISSELGGLDGSAAYLSCGEGEFPYKRLQQIATEYETIHGISSSNFLSKVHVENCHNSEVIQESLLQRVPLLCRTENLKLLVIDSLAGVVRLEFQSSKMEMIMARNEYLFKIAQQLKWLADTYKLVVVVVNQVTANFEKFPSSSSSSFSSSSNSNPALGLCWSHCISSRVRLYKNASPEPFLHSASSSRRSDGNSNYNDYNYNNHRNNSPYGNDDYNGNNNSNCDIEESDDAIFYAEDSININGCDLHDNGSSRTDLNSSLRYSNNAAASTATPAAVATASPRTRRVMSLEMSPLRPLNQCAFEVRQGGVFGIKMA